MNKINKFWRKCMGIEPTWDAAQRPTLDLKSRRATSALSTSAKLGKEYSRIILELV